MVLLKCKMCGGDIEADAAQTYGTCSHCGSTMTLPRAADEQIANFFNRANHFRRQNDFDKAMTAYENILNMDASLAEAHWGLVLSKYGIEYVEDPQSHERVPTCHRVQSDSILADADYLAAIDLAEDLTTKELYESETKRIAEIQKDILTISSQENPYDVFLCYKETTDGGSRTKDSAMAQEVYYQLTDEGYKVFFARITLEDKLGQQYEPYIFAALNSARVMAVIGTRPEHFNATWVKNEWSRYLALSKKDKNKLLIPCYGDMDAYDLPEELSMLQSLDMTKIGFVQDLIRGIRKVLEAAAIKADRHPAGNSDSKSLVPGVAQLLDRAGLFLEDGNFASADEYFDRILDLEPRNPQAYFMKLLAILQIRRAEDITAHTKPLDEYPDYQKALRFSDDSYKETLLYYNQTIIARLEQERQEGIYQKATAAMSQAKSEKGYLAAASLFDSISEYKDANHISASCRSLAEEAQTAKMRLEEEARAKVAEKQRLDREYNVIMDSLRDQIREMEKAYEKLGFFQKEKKLAIEKEISELYERMRQTRDQYGKVF